MLSPLRISNCFLLYLQNGSLPIFIGSRPVSIELAVVELHSVLLQIDFVDLPRTQQIPPNAARSCGPCSEGFACQSK